MNATDKLRFIFRKVETACLQQFDRNMSQRAPKKWLWMLLALVLCRESRAGRPQMSPDYLEIHLNEGESLELTCTSPQKMTFYYPKDVGDAIVASPAYLEEKSSGNTRTIAFRRNETVHGDTGWYGCSDEDVAINSGNYSQPDVSWTYVYVKSNSSYFVQMDTLESVRGVTGGVAIIPCRPTSPDYNVILFSNEEIEMEMGDKVSYDPKIGFELRGITLKDSGYFKCLIEEGDNSQEVNYHLLVIRNQFVNEPKIIDEPLRHVTRGQTLYVNCTINVDADIQYVFNWTTPQRSDRITQRSYRKIVALNQQMATCELIIHGVTEKDEGEYECTITTFSATKKAKTFITVYDPDVKYINLTSQNDNRFHETKYGDRVQWVVAVDAYPQPILKWLNPKGDEIVGSWNEPEKSKYAINTTSSFTILRINRVDLNDMGLYSLQATNADRIETLNFTLDVLAKPIPMLERLEAFYMINWNTQFRCHVAAFPAPEISWTFLRAPNYPSFEGSDVVSLKNYAVIPKMTTFLSTVSLEISVSGHLTCTACNTLGCDSVTDTILVSDVPGGFGIVEDDTQLTIGDSVVRTCAASIYNYTSVEWLDEKDDAISETEKITIAEEITSFTYRSTIRIKNIGKSDNNTYYVCSAKDTSGSIERYDYKLEIHDPVAPYFLETNMNKTEVAYDLTTEGHKTIILKCYVGGMPTPNITWYKDDTRIRSNEQYMCLHKNQELHIKYWLDQNSGRYMCRAENRFGREENYQNIVIKVKEVSKLLIISIGVLVAICIILVVYFAIKMRREKVMRKQLMEAGLTHFEEGALECLNPDLTVDDQAELLPYDRKWEFPRERLKFGKQLGFGAFGVVLKAEAQGICEDEAVTTVAVKMVRRSTESTYIRALASELKIMVHLGKHLNVVNLLGACTKNITKRELLVIVEYCRFGNLHNYLLRHRADFINQIDPTSGKFDPSIGLDILSTTTIIGNNNSLSGNSCSSNPSAELVAYTARMDSHGVSMSPDGCVLSNNSTQPGWRSNYHGDYKDQNLKPICTQDLLSWAFQVARGMEYLSQRKVLHGDLAARNILLSENNIVKICDFGLAKTMYKDDNYKKKGDAPLPIKWMAVESIRDRVFSTQSDIWSFGIVLWEFFTLAKTPYPGMEAEKQYQRLIEGYRMEQPEYATDEVYNIMLQCWKAKPKLRPTFSSLVSSIGDLLEEGVKEHYVDLNAPYMDMNTIVLQSGKSDYLTMMSAPDHDALSTPNGDYVNSPCTSQSSNHNVYYLPMSPSNRGSKTQIFSPRVTSESDRFAFPSNGRDTNVHSDSESDAVEISPMLNHADDNYLKPINVRQRRAEFAKQREAMKDIANIQNPSGMNMGYCNASQHLYIVDPSKAELRENTVIDGSKVNDVTKTSKDLNCTQGNYANMPRQTHEFHKDGPASFSNPSYITMDNNRRTEQMEQ